MQISLSTSKRKTSIRVVCSTTSPTNKEHNFSSKKRKIRLLTKIKPSLLTSISQQIIKMHSVNSNFNTRRSCLMTSITLVTIMIQSNSWDLKITRAKSVWRKLTIAAFRYRWLKTTAGLTVNKSRQPLPLRRDWQLKPPSCNKLDRVQLTPILKAKSSSFDKPKAGLTIKVKTRRRCKMLLQSNYARRDSWEKMFGPKWAKHVTLTIQARIHLKWFNGLEPRPQPHLTSRA